MSKQDEKTQSEIIAEAVKQAMLEALPAAAAIAAKVTADAQPKPVVQHVAPSRRGAPRCSECGQYAEACKGEHRMACIFPDDDEAAQWFQGVKLNGVRYLSNGPGHLITVPKDSDLEYTMAQWVRNEKIQRSGRKVNRNSGEIGRTNNFTPYNGSGFGER